MPPFRHAVATPGVSDSVVVEIDAWRYVGQVRTGTKTLHGRGTCTWKDGPNKGNKYEGVQGRREERPGCAHLG